MEFVQPLHQVCSFAFTRMIKNEIYDPVAAKQPCRLQKVVCASFMMSAALCSRQTEHKSFTDDSELNRMLFKNMWAVLKDSSVFITATFLNVQTLLFVVSVVVLLIALSELCADSKIY